MNERAEETSSVQAGEEPTNSVAHTTFWWKTFWNGGWRSHDPTLFLSVTLLLCVGLLAQTTLSSYGAARLGLHPELFAYRHMIVVALAAFFIVVGGSLTFKHFTACCACALPLVLSLLVATHFFGEAILGARRWLRFGSLSVQAGVFLAPVLIVVLPAIAKMYGLGRVFFSAVFGLVLMGAGALILQPDLSSMTILFMTVATVVGHLCFRQELRIRSAGMVAVGMLMLAATVTAAYPYLLDHLPVSWKYTFGYPDMGASYAKDRAADAFEAGGFFGVGPVDGVIASRIPNVHSNYVFAGFAEEFGLIGTLGIILLFCHFIGRLFYLAGYQADPYRMAVLVGAGSYMAFLVMTHVAHNVGLPGPDGTPLPFIGYGGGSLLAVSLAVAAAFVASHNLSTGGPVRRSTLGGILLVSAAVLLSVDATREFRDFRLPVEGALMRDKREFAEQLRVNEAERAYLAAPGRVRNLASRQLDFAPYTPEQFVDVAALSDIPYRTALTPSVATTPLRPSPDASATTPLITFEADFSVDPSYVGQYGLLQEAGHLKIIGLGARDAQVLSNLPAAPAGVTAIRGPYIVGPESALQGIGLVLQEIRRARTIVPYLKAIVRVETCCWYLHLQAVDGTKAMVVKLLNEDMARGLRVLSELQATSRVLEREIDIIDLRNRELTIVRLPKSRAADDQKDP